MLKIIICDGHCEGCDLYTAPAHLEHLNYSGVSSRTDEKYLGRCGGFDSGGKIRVHPDVTLKDKEE